MEFIVTYESMETDHNDREIHVPKKDKVTANAVNIIDGRLLLMESGKPNAAYYYWNKCIREDKVEEYIND